LCLGLAGSLIFTGAFIASWTTPHFISKTAREVIRYRVAQEVNEKVEALGADFLVEKAKILMKDKADEIDRLKLLLKAKIPELVAMIANQMADPDCPCRKWTPEPLRHVLLALLADATQMQERLAGLIKTKYLEVETQLTREFRIFTGTNALAFVLLTLAVLIRRRAGLHFLPVGLVLFLATSVTSYFYLFNQNWLHTIVFGDYVGFAYAAYLAFVFACLWDILLNYARITTAVLDVILSPFIYVAPC
jgi:hypothetical protein